MNLIFRKTCRFCGSNKLTKVINLGHQYLQSYFANNNYIKKKKYIFNKKFLMEIVRCNPDKDKNACGLLQLSITIPPKLLYSKYFYRSGVNSTMKQHLNNIELRAQLDEKDAEKSWIESDFKEDIETLKAENQLLSEHLERKYYECEKMKEELTEQTCMLVYTQNQITEMTQLLSQRSNDDDHPIKEYIKQYC